MVSLLGDSTVAMGFEVWKRSTVVYYGRKEKTVVKEATGWWYGIQSTVSLCWEVTCLLERGGVASSRAPTQTLWWVIFLQDLFNEVAIFTTKYWD